MNIDEMQAGRELDALIAETVMEMQRVEEGNIYFWPSPEMVARLLELHPDVLAVDYFPAPHYSTDIAAAWQIVEKLGMQCGFSIYDREPFAAHKRVSTVASTVPLAICRAALKAIRENDK